MKRYPRLDAHDHLTTRLCIKMLPEAFLPTLRQHVAECVSASIQVNRGEYLARCGQPFLHIFLIVQGSFKLVQPGNIDHDQIVGIRWPRHLIGMDGFAGRVYATDLIALESSTVYEFPVLAIERLANSDPDLLDELLTFVSEDLAQAEHLQYMLGSMNATQKMGFFFLFMDDHLGHIRDEDSHFVLPMTREEIGSFVGLSMETVSRLISHLHKRGAIDIHRQTVRILQRDLLEGWQSGTHTRDYDGDMTDVMSSS